MKPRKGSIGNHGKCEWCYAPLHRRHNKLWCPACRVAFELKKEDRVATSS